MLPDLASVNWHEQGVDVEAGPLWHGRACGRGWPHRSLTAAAGCYWNCPMAATKAEADHLLELLQASRANDLPVLSHGEGTSCWPALRQAAARGLATPIGLEDVLELPDGSPATDNTALVAAASGMLQACP